MRDLLPIVGYQLFMVLAYLDQSRFLAFLGLVAGIGFFLYLIIAYFAGAELPECKGDNNWDKGGPPTC